WNHVHKADYILKQNCIENGSTVEGRREFARKTLNSPIKLPIAIGHPLDVYMLPTSSPKSLECVWVADCHVNKFEERDEKAYSSFRDGTGMYVDISASTFHNQMIRTAHLIAQLNKPIHY